MTQIPQPINFPVFTTPLIGRDNDVTTIVDLIRNTTQPFVTMLGASGAGKTRLSLQIASALEQDFQDGMAFISLAPISEPELVIPTIARTFGLTENGTTTYQDALSTYLQGRNILIVLDNLEQVRTAAADVVAILDAAPATRILCTSQIATSIPEELVVQIPPLALPETTSNIEAIASSPAVALFVDRIRQLQPYFQLNERNSAAVVELCRRVNSLPLAIELVATHSDRIEPENLLPLLRAYLPRERNRNTETSPEQIIFPVLSWCIAYGDQTVRWLLPRLGALRGDWRIDQAAALCHDQETDFDLEATLKLMVSKGLLLELEQNTQSGYTMLDAIRQFALRRLESDQELNYTVRQQHLEHFSSLAAQIDSDFRSGNSKVAGPLMTQAMSNIRAALQWAFEQQDYDHAATIVQKLVIPGYYQGYIRELLNWVERLEPFESQFGPMVQLGWFYGRGVLAYAISDYSAALAAYAQGMQQARALDNEDYLARMQNNSAIILTNQGRYAEARAAYEEVLRVREKEENRWNQATTLNNLGIVALEEGDLAGALNYYQQSIALLEAMDDLQALAAALINACEILLLQDEFAEAEAMVRRAVAYQAQLEQSTIQAIGFHTLGHLLLHTDNPAAYAEAQTLLRTSLEVALRNNTQREIAFGLEGYARWLTKQRHFTDAARVLGAAAALREQTGEVLTRIQTKLVNRTKKDLDTVLKTANRIKAEQAGAAMALDEIMNLVNSK